MFNFLNKIFKSGKKAIETDKNVLIGLAKNPSQYEANIKYNFYHIPADRFLSLSMPVKYIAILKPSKFFPKEETGVYVYGKVKSATVLPRCEIKEFHRQSHEKYIRFDVEEWIELPSPIPQGEIIRIISFTSLDILFSAKCVTELYMPNKKAIDFFRFLQKECRHINSNDFIEYEYNEINVAFIEEYIELIYPNAYHIKYRRADYHNRPYALYHEIMH